MQHVAQTQQHRTKKMAEKKPNHAPAGQWQKIAAAREAAHLTQQQLAEHAGVSRGLVALWESKKVSNRSKPTIHQLYKRAEATGVPVRSLFDEDDRVLADMLTTQPTASSPARALASVDLSRTDSLPITSGDHWPPLVFGNLVFEFVTDTSKIPALVTAHPDQELYVILVGVPLAGVDSVATMDEALRVVMGILGEKS